MDKLDQFSQVQDESGFIGFLLVAGVGMLAVLFVAAIDRLAHATGA